MFDPYLYGATLRTVNRSRAERVEADAVLGELVTRWAGRLDRLRTLLGTVRFERRTATVSMDSYPPLDESVDRYAACLDGQPG
jgi:hypothetical protein